MIIALVLAFTAAQPVFLPGSQARLLTEPACGMTPQHPCYTSSVPAPSQKFEVGSDEIVLHAGTVYYAQALSECALRMRCEKPQDFRLVAYEQVSRGCPAPPACVHDHGYEKAAWGFVSVVGSVGAWLVGLAFFMSRVDRIVGAWRRAELPKRWWWPPLAWLGEQLFACAVIFGALMLSKALGW